MDGWMALFKGNDYHEPSFFVMKKFHLGGNFGNLLLAILSELLIIIYLDS